MDAMKVVLKKVGLVRSRTWFQHVIWKSRLRKCILQ